MARRSSINHDILWDPKRDPDHGPHLSSDGGPAGRPTGKRRDTKPKRKPRPKRKTPR